MSDFINEFRKNCVDGKNVKHLLNVIPKDLLDYGFTVSYEYKHINLMDEMYSYISETLKMNIFDELSQNKDINLIIFFLKKGDLAEQFYENRIVRFFDLYMVKQTLDYFDKNLANRLFYLYFFNQNILFAEILLPHVEDSAIDEMFIFCAKNLKMNCVKFFSERLPFNRIQNIIDKM